VEDALADEDPFPLPYPEARFAHDDRPRAFEDVEDAIRADVAVDLRGLARGDEDEIDGDDVLERCTPRDLCDLEYVEWV
jgi:hypothetical protein